MKKYTTIFIDIDNLVYQLYTHRHMMHRYGREMVEQIFKKGLKSLHDFEVIALLGKDEKYGKNYILKNHLEFMKALPRKKSDSNKRTDVYLDSLLKHFNKDKKEVLVVSGNSYMLEASKSLEIDTCYFNIFEPNPLNIKTTMTIKKLEELKQYHLIKKQIIEEKQNASSNYHYYIDSSLLKILEEREITLNDTYDVDKERFLKYKPSDKVPFAITMDLALAMYLRKQGCTIYFVNNHCNDNIDYVVDYESTIESLPKQLKKIMNQL